MAEPRSERAIATAPRHGGAPDPQALARIEDALRGLQYGAVTVIVQDGIVVQVDRTEKLRLHRARA